MLDAHERLLAHLVGVRTSCLAGDIFGLERIVDRNIKISTILIIGPHHQVARDFFILLNCQHLPKIKYCLFPVRVFSVWASRKADRLVAPSEVDVEPCDQGVYEVITTAFQGEWYRKGKVGGCAGVQVQCNHGRRVRDSCLDLNGINERFGESGRLQRRIVEPVDVIPNCRWSAIVGAFKSRSSLGAPTSNLLILIFSIFNATHKYSSLVREYQAILFEVFVPSV